MFTGHSYQHSSAFRQAHLPWPGLAYTAQKPHPRRIGPSRTVSQ